MKEYILLEFISWCRIRTGKQKAAFKSVFSRRNESVWSWFLEFDSNVSDFIALLCTCCWVSTRKIWRVISFYCWEILWLFGLWVGCLYSGRRMEKQWLMCFAKHAHACDDKGAGYHWIYASTSILTFFDIGYLIYRTSRLEDSYFFYFCGVKDLLDNIWRQVRYALMRHKRTFMYWPLFLKSEHPCVVAMDNMTSFLVCESCTLSMVGI